jgi:AbrB family looped-hinge helix DNA binding protein
MRPVKLKRRRGFTRLSSKRQVTLPLGTLTRLGLRPGDEFKVEAEGGRIVLVPSQSLAERRRAAIEATAGGLTGVYEEGGLDRMRDEWR